jgi:hypothetical protein
MIVNEITHYTVLRGNIKGEVDNDYELEKEVQRHIRKGWQPLGPAMPVNDEYAVQTMVIQIQRIVK